MTGDTIVLDVETQKTFQEVGGDYRPELLKVSVAGAYSYARNEYRAFLESEMKELEAWLVDAALVVGFNIVHFDFPVLAPYFSLDTTALPVCDIMVDLKAVLGHRVKLSSVTQATLHAGKSGDGLKAIRDFREGRVEDVKRYCLDDVRLTKELYDYGRTHGHLKVTDLSQAADRVVPVPWGTAAAQVPTPAVQAALF